MSFEDKFKANLERGNAELEKRRQTLQDAERRERERRAQIEREEREKREKEAREIEERRRREEEIRLERQKEIERHNEEERLREIERKEVRGRRFCTQGFWWERSPIRCTAESRLCTLQCPVWVLRRLHSGSSSVRGRRSGRGGGKGSSR